MELPLNGRNFSQLGLLQTGVAPISAGVVTQGGSMRSGQAYAVNGQRPESNNYLLDGAQNVNRVDAGYALKVPVDAIAEFRILTHTAPPEYGGFSGSTTSVVTKGGNNTVQGTAYEFFRNDVLDARNFFSARTEALRSHADCQRRRRSDYHRQRIETDPEYRQVCLDSPRKWRAQHPDYWRKYRQTHPEAVKQNRRKQQDRDQAYRLADLANNNLAFDVKSSAAKVTGSGPAQRILQTTT